MNWRKKGNKDGKLGLKFNNNPEWFFAASLFHKMIMEKNLSLARDPINQLTSLNKPCLLANNSTNAWYV